MASRWSVEPGCLHGYRAKPFWGVHLNPDRQSDEPSQVPAPLTDSVLRGLIVNFDATIAKIDAPQGGALAILSGYSPLRARPDHLCRALPHRPNGIPQPELSGQLPKRKREMQMGAAVSARRYDDGARPSKSSPRSQGRSSFAGSPCGGSRNHS